METLEELQTKLLVVNNAIQKTLAGERITRFETGSGASSRTYEYEEVSLETLNKERFRILSNIQSLSVSEPTFRTSSRMQLTYRKI